MGATVARWRMSPGKGESEASDGGEREMGQATAIQVERMKDGQTYYSGRVLRAVPGGIAIQASLDGILL